MRILVIGTDSGESEQHLRDTEKLLQQAVADDVEIRVTCQQRSEVCVDSNVDVVITGPETLERARQAEADGYDAICLYCGADPAYDAVRELIHIPVIGSAHACFAMAMTLGYQYALITTSKRRIPQKKEFARSCGIDISRLVSVRAVDYDFKAPRTPAFRTKIIKELAEVAKLCAEEDCADVIVLGCLSFAGMAREISELSGVPVIDPGLAMIAMAEAVVRQGISHSKIAYPDIPPNTNRSWSAGSLNT